MNRLLWMAGMTLAALGITGWVMAQDAAMPGQVVSTTAGEKLKLIGKELPQVAKPVGKAVNLPTNNPLFRPYNPANPYEALGGTGLNVNSVVAPVTGYQTEVPKSSFEQFTSSVKSLLGITTPPKIQNIYTPGIYRRDRQRVKERWVRD